MENYLAVLIFLFSYLLWLYLFLYQRTRVNTSVAGPHPFIPQA